MRVTQQPRRGFTELGPGQPTEIVAFTRPTSPPDLRPHTTLTIPGYDIIRLIDHGGMSHVYLARQHGLERQVAIKILRPEDFLDDQLRKRFMLEASSIAALQHPNVVQIYEIGEAEGMPYLCLEYIAGGNLERRLRERLPSFQESADIVRQLADAIQAAHEREIVHRDLKPANILCMEMERPNDTSIGSSPKATVKITDFGLARVLCDRSDQTKSGFAIGTPSFMSPEQASGNPSEIGKGTDIYGLGAILYELLTGVPPFMGITSLETIRMVRFEAPIPPSQMVRSVPRDLESICLQCLEKLPENRYASARDLSADLRRFLQGRTVKAHAIGPVRKWLGRCRRHPLRTFSIVGCAVMMLTGATGIYLLNRATDHLIEREQALDRTREQVVAPEPGAVPPTMPADIQQVLNQIRQNPTRPENGKLLANLSGDWMVRLLQENPQDFAIQFGVGEAHLQAKSPQLAQAAFDRARQIAEEQTRQMDGGVEAWANLASAHERLGDIHVLQKDRRGAIREYERTLAKREMLAQDDPGERRWLEELSSICRKQAELYAEEPNEGLTAVMLYDRRLGLLNKLVLDDPSLNSAIRATHERMAQLHRQLGNTAAAEFHDRILRDREKTP